MEENKYWIEAGKCARHKERGINVTVERIVRNGKEGEKKFVKGVMCHWLNEQNGYESGMFMTTELEKCES